MSVKLYNVAYSGNSYKVRLLLAQLGIPFEIIEIDILKGESRTAELLKINPNGRTPVFDDNGFVLAESNAILAYLAHGTKLLPEDRQDWLECFSGYSSNSTATNLTSPPPAFGYSTNLIRPNAIRF